ncbi:MAG: SH3 domain-containing protein [Gammaproteobacteria bacterium]|nr:SH3 domain-containing protein [Gammaproteobacteria bacterium]
MFLALTLCLSVSAATLSVVPSPAVTSFVSIRTQPDTDGVLLAALRPGNSAPVIGAVGDWYVVNWEGATGYISRNWVEIVAGDSSSTLSDAELDALKAQVTADKIIPIDSVSSFVRVREQPDMSSKMIAALYQGQSLPLVSETADWYVVTASGKTGYISRSWGQKIGSDQLPAALYSDNETSDVTAKNIDPVVVIDELPVAETLAMPDEEPEPIVTEVLPEQRTVVTTPDEKLVVAAPVVPDEAPPVIESEPIPAIAPIEKAVVPDYGPVRITPSDRVETFALIRAEPSTDSAILSRLPPKNSVIMISESDDWYTVVRNGKTGYISRYWTEKIGGAGDIIDTRTPYSTAQAVDEVVSPSVSESIPVAETETFGSPAADSTSDTVAMVTDESPKSPPAESMTDRKQPITNTTHYPLQSSRQSGDRARMMAATDLLERGQTYSAYSMLSELAPAWAGHAGFDYLLGVAALSSGNAAEAVFSLDRVVYALPGFVGARLELARALYEVGDYGRARKEFQALLDAQPPAAVREIIVGYLNALLTANEINLKKFPFERTVLLGAIR